MISLNLGVQIPHFEGFIISMTLVLLIIGLAFSIRHDLIRKLDQEYDAKMKCKKILKKLKIKDLEDSF